MSKNNNLLIHLGRFSRSRRGWFRISNLVRLCVCIIVGLAANTIGLNPLKTGFVRSANLTNYGFDTVVVQSPSVSGKADRLLLPLASISPSAKVKTQHKKTVQVASPDHVHSYLKLFDTVAFRTNGFSRIKTWKRVMARITNERSFYQRCEKMGSHCSPLAQQWLMLLKALRSFKGKGLVQELNFAVNVLGKYRKDVTVYNQSDYWASPLEFFQSGGDCEDFAIAKYVSFLELGVPANDMRIVVVHDKKLNIGHAVLLIAIDGERYVLDNRSHALLDPLDTSHYQPLYSVNRSTRWIHVKTRRTAIHS